MTTPASDESYRATLVPALHKIQEDHGYLDHTALKEFSQRASVPLFRLQAVASFFPHFRLSPPKKVTLRVCRDMACHLAGSGQMLGALRSLEDGQVAVEARLVSGVATARRPRAWPSPESTPNIITTGAPGMT